MVFPLLSRPLKTTATIALHNRTEVHYSALSCVGYCRGYCVSLERPLDNRRGAEGEEKEREGSGTERSEENRRELERLSKNLIQSQEKEQKFRKSTG